MGRGQEQSVPGGRSPWPWGGEKFRVGPLWADVKDTGKTKHAGDTRSLRSSGDDASRLLSYACASATVTGGDQLAGDPIADADAACEPTSRAPAP